ncbi:MAG: hypothetical protein J6Q78_02120 [Clostridia bacterium]|nr:hypothetical protein [Clostridia bacterium]
MKRSVRILALGVVAVILCMALASCGTLSGTYKNDGLFGFGATEIEFKGSKMYVNMGGIEAEAKYSVKGDKITIEFQDEDEDNADISDIFELLNGEHDFEKGDDYIKIGDVKYKKK